MRIKYNKGFTLIEIIIVIVIIGVLATLALPKVTGQMEAVKAGEAMAMFGTIKRAADQCYSSKDDDMTECLTFSQLGVDTGANSKFSYYADVIGTTGITVTAAMEDRADNLICMEFNADAGSVTFSYTTQGNPYASIVTKSNPAGAVTTSVTCQKTGTKMWE